ncbi:MAG: carbohydrate-binding protein [Fibrobacteres bacterium]|nr:carbohydrate-binding protein [Fibrobacterota bacterium]
MGALASGAALLLMACSQDSGPLLAGGWTDTETGPKVAGIIQRDDGSPAVGALVLLRPADYLGKDPTSQDSLGETASGGTVLDAFCDSAGVFAFEKVALGSYTLESRDREIKAVAVRFNVDRDKGRLTLAAATVRAVGTITGRVRFQDGAPGRVLVRIFGLERAVVTDASGAYFFGNVPAGRYTLHFSGLDPFILPADRPDVGVAPGASSDAGEILLQRGLKQGFRIADGVLELAGIDSTNPVIFENGASKNPVDGAYLWAKASMGHLDLRGTIVTYAQDTGAAAINVNLKACARIIRFARNSGMRGMVEPVAGARRMLTKAPGGRLEDIKSDASDGALLLIREARKATVAKPLVFFSGANLTTAAEALLLDPAIADRMVVFGANNDNYNIRDSLALALVSKKARFVEWARDYIWPYISQKDQDSFPGNRLGESIRTQYAKGGTATLATFAFYGDFGAATWLFRPKVWTGATPADLKGPPLKADVSTRAAFDFVDIPAEGTDWELMQDEFFNVITDPAAYHPWPWTGRIEAESYRAASNATADSSAEEQTDVVTWKAVGGWTEYPIQVDAAGDYTVEFRYRSLAQSGLKLIDSLSAVETPVNLPATSVWTSTAADIHLEAGLHILRLQSTQGALELNWMNVSVLSP